MCSKEDAAREEKSLLPSKQRNTLPKNARITSSSCFSELLKRGHRVKGEFVDVYWNKSGQETVMFAVTFRRKTGTPAKRNRVKRIVREYMRSHVIHNIKNIKVIIIAKRVDSEAAANAAVIWGELDKLFRGIGE